MPCGDEKVDYVFTGENMELAPFAKMCSTGSYDPLEKKTLFLLYIMLEKRFDESTWVLRSKAPLSRRFSLPGGLSI